MKKIMFDDRYGLTQAVIEGRKTMTRRLELDADSEYIARHYNYINRSIATTVIREGCVS